MKLIQHLAFSAALLATAGAASAQCVAGSPLIVGPADQFAFQWCNGGASPTQLGLRFASSASEFQFTNVSGSPIVTINPTAAGYTRMGAIGGGNYAQHGADGDLTFVGNADYLVGSNRYAFRSSADQDNGLFFNVALNQYEFRANDASSGFAIKANTVGGATKGSFQSTGNGDIDGRLVVGNLAGDDNNGINAQGYANGRGAVRGEESSGGTIYSTGYLGVLSPASLGIPILVTNVGVLGIKEPNGSNGAGVYGWNNDVNFTNYGGIFAATGTTAGTNYGVYARATGATNNIAGYFDGDVTVTGNLTATGLATVTGAGSNNFGTVGVFRVLNTGLFGNSSLGMDGNEIQSYNSVDSAGGTLFLNYWGGNMDIIDGSINPNGTLTIGTGNLFVTNVTDRVGVGTSSPAGKLHVQGNNVERALNVIYGAATTAGQVANIESTTALASGNDLLQLVMASGSSTTAAFIEAENAGIKFQVNGDGHIGVGTTASTLYAIQACGSVRATEVVVETGWCDYVFADDYRLAPLSEVESFIQANKHLPGIPSAAVVESEGMKVAQMSSNFMLKIEELTLYTIEQEKQINTLQSQIDELKALLVGQK